MNQVAIGSLLARRARTGVILLALALFALGPVTRARAQSLTSGDITGVVSDPTGASIPNATVTLLSPATGAQRTATTGAHGAYLFSLVQPGTYVLSVKATGFTSKTGSVVVSVAQTRTVNFALQVGSSAQTVTVTGEVAPVQTSNANVATTFSAQQVNLLPNGGGDLTAMVQTAPGAVMNTMGGLGNFSTFGLPGTSNLFTVNGQPDNDPFLNLNNSGPTNLMLGSSGVEQVTVTNNGYSGQYGGFGGSNVAYVTKSGTNNWHGSAVYNWNGRAMNANSFFNNANGTARPFDNINNWTAGFGGPIVKNHTFFFVNTDGLYVLLPTSQQVLTPSPQFQAATLTNLAQVGQSAEIPFYQHMFSLYNNAVGAGSAKPLASGTGCNGLAVPNFGAGTPCALAFQSAAGNRTHEWDLAARVDQHIGNNDLLYFRYSVDRGIQATSTDPISPVFDISSNQPEYQGQLGWTHSFTGGSVNQLNASVNHYSAIFGTNPAPRLALMPETLQFNDGAFSSLGGIDAFFPQGRNVTQYSARDDFSTVRGNQTWKLGGDWTLNYINDFDLGSLTSPLTLTTIGDFFQGQSLIAIQNFPTELNQPVQMYRLGAYVEDDVAVTPSLHTTVTLRVEHHSNPICLHDCVSRLTAPFNQLVHDASVPYNQIIQTGLRQGYPSNETYLWQPRFGFAWTPFRGQHTVLRGGFGLFNDTMPGQIMDSLAGNAPNLNQFIVNGTLAPGTPGNIFDAAAQSNAAFLAGFRSGETLAQIEAADPNFAPPSFTSTQQKVQPARYYEWNLEVQQQIGANSAVSANYVGNHGVHEPVLNNGINGFDPGFAGLPAAAPDARFGTVTLLQDIGISNYNGLVLSVRHQMSSNLELQANYTWSHALDEVSNGGFNSFSGGFQSPVDPFNLRRFNYGNAAYDVRNYFDVNYVYTIPFTTWFGSGMKALTNGWTLSGDLFARSGMPFSVVDSAASGTLSGQNFGGPYLASVIGPGGQASSCQPNSATSPCLNLSAFAPSNSSPAGFGNQTRNQFRGPKFFDTDLSVFKNTAIPGWESAQLGLGAQFFNLFNHANFSNPVNDIASSQFGEILSTVSVPTSLLGSFLGGDASPRLIELTAKLTF